MRRKAVPAFGPRFCTKTFFVRGESLFGQAWIAQYVSLAGLLLGNAGTA
jgi:hypothetical protein